MATHLSPANPVRSILQPKQNPPKALLSIRDSYGAGLVWKKCQPSTVNVCSWSSAASYVTPPGGAAKFSGNPIVVKKQLLQKRAGTVRAATIEEIEAEKSVIEKDAKGRMEKTIETVRSNFNSIRTGRASPAMLDKIEVDYYGSPVGLKSLAQISSPDGTSLLISPYDKSSLKSIEKAIVASDLGMTPNNDGEVIRLTLPQLTSDRRKELTKVVSKQAEEGKVALRNIRRDALKAYEKLQKEKKLSEDTLKDFSSDLQKWTDEYVKKLDTISKQKEKELLKV
ncbi:PREDICTED: ribosome-recycling factor, chloroplastic [Fragaria vesca subsp. vesca]|uniref:ribosome-recycling factor, chloroplastic n=1 Tax=Fragaria vesca subsp. vesca TaxID=101020 RepID=UPI0002C36FC2|nr:PREDICTED: ribosome-recycling factor, chloroplastic [Fragaria vesca subsp. vesca]